MKFHTEHTGYIKESTIVEFELPNYVGCISIQIFVTKFDGDISISYIDKSNTERLSTIVLPSLHDSTKSIIVSSIEQMSKIKFNITFPSGSVGSLDKITIIT
jgi:hypothetical protein